MADIGAVDVVDANPTFGGRRMQSPAPPPTYALEDYNDLEDHHFEYHMKHKERGVAIIINNEEFESRTGMGSRTGSSVDRDNLQKVLKFVGFKDIRVKNNLRQKDMINLMQDVASENHKDRDCLFVAMLSHGDEEGIYGTDYPIGYEELMAPFKECKSLVGKPKIFVVQACRGDKLDDGSTYKQDALPTSQKQYRISKESDFLVAYSVVPGHYSWRNVQKGSWFMQAFCQVMLRDGRRLELVELLTRVNRMVSYTFQSNASIMSMTDKKQSPCITSMLTKRLYFA